LVEQEMLRRLAGDSNASGSDFQSRRSAAPDGSVSEVE